MQVKIEGFQSCPLNYSKKQNIYKEYNLVLNKNGFLWHALDVWKWHILDDLSNHHIDNLSNGDNLRVALFIWKTYCHVSKLLSKFVCINNLCQSSFKIPCALNCACYFACCIVNHYCISQYLNPFPDTYLTIQKLAISQRLSHTGLLHHQKSSTCNRWCFAKGGWAAIPRISKVYRRDKNCCDPFLSKLRPSNFDLLLNMMERFYSYWFHLLNSLEYCIN